VANKLSNEMNYVSRNGFHKYERNEKLYHLIRQKKAIKSDSILTLIIDYKAKQKKICRYSLLSKGETRFKNIFLKFLP